MTRSLVRPRSKAVVAQVIAPVDIDPDLVGPGIDSHANCFAQPFGVKALTGPIQVEFFHYVRQFLQRPKRVSACPSITKSA